ncbi:MAG: hypothetical protein FJ387_23990 [Verrucomicrobia bacterium]|nr:hypothetical protein [Verrucomicrobiota bacterium]
MSTDGAPEARCEHSALWTGQELLVLGGEAASGAVGTGAAYDPAGDRWRALTSAGNPRARSGAVAVWTGTEVLTFGGSVQGQVLGALQRLDPQPSWYLYRQP